MPHTANERYVFERIGMALVSAQRVEIMTGKLLEHLYEFREHLSPFTSDEFLANTKNGIKARKTLGEIFKILKLNSQWVLEDELNEYLKKRNLFVHGFWMSHLQSKSKESTDKAVEFCNEFGLQSNKIESFFKGFMYFLALRDVQYVDKLDPVFKLMEKDFQYFLSAMKEKSLLQSKDNTDKI